MDEAAAGLTEEQVADLKEAFAMFDINGDGMSAKSPCCGACARPCLLVVRCASDAVDIRNVLLISNVCGSKHLACALLSISLTFRWVPDYSFLLFQPLFFVSLSIYDCTTIKELAAATVSAFLVSHEHSACTYSRYH